MFSSLPGKSKRNLQKEMWDVKGNLKNDLEILEEMFGHGSK